MAKIVGRNALVYVGGDPAPERNQTSLNFTRELSEARVYQPVTPGGPWADQIPGFRTWTVNINGYYDDTADGVLNQLNTDVPQQVIVYETRENLTKYWYGNAMFNISEEIGVDDVITLNLTGTGTGALTRIPVPS